MGTYHYQAKRGPRDLLTGVIEADSRPQALEKLSQQGFFPLSVEEFQSQGKARWIFWKDISKQELVFFTRQLADLLESHVPLLRALELAQDQTDNAALRRLVHALMEHIRGGKSFSESLAEFPQHFSPLYIHLVYAGEVGGMLSAIMERLAVFMEQEEEFQSRLQTALAYPAFIAFIGGLTVIFLMLFVVPRLTAMFVDTEQGMPWIARVLSFLSGALRSFSGLTFLSFLITALAWMVIRTPRQARVFLTHTLFKLPVWGTVMKKGMLARFAKTLAMLLSGGVPMMRALQVGAYVLNHPHYRAQVQKVEADVEQGRSFSESLRATRLFPVFVCQMIAIGEEANTLERALEKIAVTYERQADRAMKLATSLLEPLMILGVGAVIGVIVIGMLLPIFQISTFVR